MRRVVRLSFPGDILQASISSTRPTALPLGRACQRRTPGCSAALSTFSARERPDFLERTRRRIWGTDKPPGADDPYTGESWRHPGARASEGDLLTSGGDEAQARQDARLYEHQALREAREIYQQSVDAAAEHGEYVPANTWDGLEMVGGETDWDGGATFRGFQTSRKLETPEEITMAIYRATVEVFLAASAEESLTDLAEPRDGALITVAKDVRIKVQAGNVRLEFPEAKTIQKLVASIRSQPEGHESAISDQPAAQNYTRESLQKDLQALGREWLHVPLTNIAIKFAIIRRVMQLTGISVPDYLISEVRSMALLVSKLAVAPKATRLAEDLSAGPLPSLNNVRVMQRRETPIDKEKQVGRWKLIEDELVRRDLPVVGRW